MPKRGNKRSDSTRRKSRKQKTDAYASTQKQDKVPARAQAGIARTGDGDGRDGIMRRAASKVADVFNRLTGRRKPQPLLEHSSSGEVAGRAAKRVTDIPFDQIENAYTPTQTSLKGPFRTSGADRQRDQEFARGVADDGWNDEDRFTNKSGDPRIGTHGRTYEPGESIAARGRNEENE